MVILAKDLSQHRDENGGEENPSDKFGGEEEGMPSKKLGHLTE